MSAPQHPPRTVTLVLCTALGELIGALPPFETPIPWWPESSDVVAAARASCGIRVTILRLLSAVGPGPGGPVTYLAELREERGPLDGLAPWTGVDPIAAHPLRMPWARPGGPAAELAWAEAALREAGRRAGEPVQIRTWNLSSIWRIPTDHGDAWLKTIPPFFAHEGAVIEYLAQAAARRPGDAPHTTPPLIARDAQRVLLADVPGEDQYEASPAVVLSMIDSLVWLQAEMADPLHRDSLLAMGLPDWRRDPLRHRGEAVYSRYGDELSPDERTAIEKVLERWDERFAALEDCGLPDTLVHGDFHPGNVRGEPTRLVILDWGDSGVGHPLLDQTAMLERAPAPARAELAAHWADSWRAAVPGSDPDRAAALLRPVAALRHAAIYLGFLDAIEPDERVYHAGDPVFWLRRAARAGAD